MKQVSLGIALSVIIVVSCIVFALSFYIFQGYQERNNVYMALYFDNLAVDLFNANFSYEAVTIVSGIADSYCLMYESEIWTMGSGHYSLLCDMIQNRTSLFIMCSDLTQDCPEYKIQELEQMIINAGPLAQELMDNPPNMFKIFNDNGGLNGRS